jgi:hypothetical protein
MCTVPDFYRVRANTAEATWSDVGFTGDFNRLSGGNFRINTQSLAPGSMAPCNSSINVDD